MILIVLDSFGLVPDSVFRTEEILPEFRVPDSGPDLKVPHKPVHNKYLTLSSFIFFQLLLFFELFDHKLFFNRSVMFCQNRRIALRPFFTNVFLLVVFLFF